MDCIKLMCLYYAHWEQEEEGRVMTRSESRREALGALEKNPEHLECSRVWEQGHERYWEREWDYERKQEYETEQVL